MAPWRTFSQNFCGVRFCKLTACKYGTNEADNKWISNRIKGILKLSYLWQNFGIPISVC